MTAELLPYYQERKLLRHVDGVGTVEEVTARIFAVFEKPVLDRLASRPPPHS